ncbi:MAG TPA: MMPL family transporter, partial [Gammaproteobacteria bacterium]
GRVGVAASTISALALGIVVDDTIHFLSKYLRMRRESGLSAEAAIRQVFVTVGPAMLTTSLILVGGFLVLTTSTFTVNREIGQLTAMALTLAFVMDLLFLPTLLLNIEEKKNEEATAAITAA